MLDDILAAVLFLLEAANILGGGSITRQTMSKAKFIAIASADCLDHLVCWTGQDQGGTHHNVTATAPVTLDAESAAVLIARLLTWYDDDPIAAEHVIGGGSASRPTDAEEREWRRVRRGR